MPLRGKLLLFALGAAGLLSPSFLRAAEDMAPATPVTTAPAEAPVAPPPNGDQIATAPGTLTPQTDPTILTQTVRGQVVGYTLPSQTYAVTQQTQLMGMSFLYLQALGGWVQGAGTTHDDGTTTYRSTTPTRVLKQPVAERELSESEAQAYIKPKNADCPPGSKIQKDAEDILNKTPVKAKSATGARGVDAACQKIIQRDGSYGPWGEHIYRTLSPEKQPALFQKNLSDMPSLCPKFSSMENEEKRKFWVWVFMAMADRESSCRERITARGPNGTAAGVLQLHLGSEGNYGGCPASTRALVATDSFSCAARMLNGYVRKTGSLFANVGSTYWQVLHKNSDGARTRDIIRGYGGCR